MPSDGAQSSDDVEQEEPARVWEVSCTCGYSEKFRHRQDAREVYDYHGGQTASPFCGAASMEGMHAYPKGGVDPEKTLPAKVRSDG